MTYEEIVEKVRESLENADARDIFEHIAVQVNITGEGSGAFYIEVANRSISVEPYDYVDRDGMITATGESLIAVATGKLAFEEAICNGQFNCEGDMRKFAELSRIRLKKPAKKQLVKKSEAAAPKTTQKKKQPE